MTSTKATTPAGRRYTGPTLDSIQAMEFETAPFTDAELDAIDRYTAAVRGIPDCFDVPGLGPVPGEFTPDDVLGMIRAHFEMLTTWREAIRTLREFLASPAPGLSTAAERYIGGELAEWHRARESYRSGAIEHLLGRDRYGCPFDSARPAEGYRYIDGMFWIDAAL